MERALSGLILNLHYYNGRVLLYPEIGSRITKMAKTGRSEKWQLSGQYGLEIRNPDACHGLLIHCA
jgi:hypothetical protein